MVHLPQSRTSETLLISNEHVSMDNFVGQLRRATKLRISLVSRLTLCANGGCPYSDQTIPVLEYHIRIVDCTDPLGARALASARSASERGRATARATVSAAAGAAVRSEPNLPLHYITFVRILPHKFDSLPLPSSLTRGRRSRTSSERAPVVTRAQARGSGRRPGRRQGHQPGRRRERRPGRRRGRR